jgi:acetyl-CoA hydrolase
MLLPQIFFLPVSLHAHWTMKNMLTSSSVIIKKCAHPDYVPILEEYFNMAEWLCLKKGWGHEPQLLWNSFDMHKNLIENGTMKLDKWDFSMAQKFMA